MLCSCYWHVQNMLCQRTLFVILELILGAASNAARVPHGIGGIYRGHLVS